jgi:hypothetical protein
MDWIRIMIFWDGASCSVVEIGRRFRDYTAQHPRRQSVTFTLAAASNSDVTVGFLCLQNGSWEHTACWSVVTPEILPGEKQPQAEANPSPPHTPKLRMRGAVSPFQNRISWLGVHVVHYAIWFINHTASHKRGRGESLHIIYYLSNLK